KKSIHFIKNHPIIFHPAHCLLHSISPTFNNFYPIYCTHQPQIPRNIMLFISTLATLVSLTTALPKGVSTSNPNAQTLGLIAGPEDSCPNTGTPGNFIICAKPDFMDCEYQLYTSACFVPTFSISSIGVDAGGECTTYTSKDCTGREIFYCNLPAGVGGYAGCGGGVTAKIGCPGYKDLQAGPDPRKDGPWIRSIKCEKIKRN
ncbi:hypothetical protein BKA63DRAFT_576080, partial [Paraphoma chrysanthemicola]